MNSAVMYNERAAHYRYANRELGMAPVDANEFADIMMEGTGFKRGDWVGQHVDLHAAADEARMERDLGYDERIGQPLPDVPDVLLDEYHEDLDLMLADAAWYGDEASA